MTTCSAVLYIDDDYGDNSATINCQLPGGHTGFHVEVFRGKAVRIEWEKDESGECPGGWEGYGDDE